MKLGRFFKFMLPTGIPLFCFAKYLEAKSEVFPYLMTIQRTSWLFWKKILYVR